jgi:hypothetical protein
MAPIFGLRSRQHSTSGPCWRMSADIIRHGNNFGDMAPFLAYSGHQRMPKTSFLAAYMAIKRLKSLGLHKHVDNLSRFVDNSARLWITLWSYETS